MKNTKIEYADHSWSPWRGCRKVSPGCQNCSFVLIGGVPLGIRVIKAAVEGIPSVAFFVRLVIRNLGKSKEITPEFMARLYSDLSTMTEHD